MMPGEIPAQELSDGAVARSFDGIHILSPSLYPALSSFADDGIPFSIIDFYRAVAPRTAIARYDIPVGRSWFDVGNPDTLRAADNFYSSTNI